MFKSMNYRKTGRPSQFNMKKVAKKKTKKKPAMPPRQDTKTDIEPFDFGGLPDRNLKKNLGC